MTIRRRLPSAGLSLVILASGVSALTKTSLSGQGKKTFRITGATRSVYVNAVATDHQGNPVTDLSQKDFTILDNGVPQRITSFSPIDATTSNTSVRPLAAGVYSNRPDLCGAPPSVIVLLFDRRGSPRISSGYNLGPVREFLRQIQPKDHIGIYVLRDHLQVVHSFCRDASDLASAIQSYDESLSHHTSAKSTADSTGIPALDSALSASGNALSHDPNRAQDVYEFSDRPTLDTLNAIARQLSGIPGRRELVWVTDFVGDVVLAASSDMEQYLPLWRERSPDAPLAYPLGVDILQMARLVNNAGIAFYEVDAAPLQKGRDDLKSNPDAPAMMLPTPTARQHFEMNEVEHKYLTGFARRTGGRSFLKPSKNDTALQIAENDERFSYTLAYSPSRVKKWDGEWRHIQVKVNRPGVVVLARTGYLALPSDLPSEDHTHFLDSIAATPLDATQLLFRVRITPWPIANGAEIDATVHVPPESLAAALTAEPNGHWTGRFEIVFAQLDGQHHVIGLTPRQINANLPPDKHVELFRNGWNLPVRLGIKPGTQTLCVILHDENSDAVGSVHIPLRNAAQTARP